MRVVDLFESESPAIVAKELHKEFVAIAKEYGLLLRGGMGWPRVTQKGMWSGGGIAAGKRGVDDALMGMKIEQCVNAFLVDVAEKLEAVIKDGRTVLIGNGASADEKTAEPAQHGSVFSQLKAGMQVSVPPGGKSYEEKVPSVTWFISHPSHMVGMKTIVGSVSFIHNHITKIEEGGPFTFYCAFPAKEARALVKMGIEIREYDRHFWNKRHNLNSKFNKLQGVSSPEVEKQFYKHLHDAVQQLYTLGGYSTTTNNTEPSLYFDAGFPSKVAKPIDAVEFSKIVRELYVKVSELA